MIPITTVVNNKHELIGAILGASFVGVLTSTQFSYIGMDVNSIFSKC